MIINKCWCRTFRKHTFTGVLILPQSADHLTKWCYTSSLQWCYRQCSAGCRPGDKTGIHEGSTLSEGKRLSASVRDQDTFPTIQKLASSFQKSELVRQEQQQHLSTLRRQMQLLEQRLTACEVALENREGELTELSRVTGDLQSEAAGVEQVLRQIEKRVDLMGGDSHLKGRVRESGVVLDHEISSDRDAPREWSTLLEERLKTVRAEILREVQGLLASESASSTNSMGQMKDREKLEEVDTWKGRMAKLEENLENLQSKVEKQIDVYHASTPFIESEGEPGAFISTERSLLDQLRRDGVVAFRDKKGKVRLASAVIRVRNAPTFWGASHVRELCELKVGGVLSCLLIPLPSSAEQNNNLGSVELGMPTSTSNERGFTVTFRSAEKAVKALMTLDHLCVSSQTKLRQSGRVENEVMLMIDPVLPSTAEALVKKLQPSMKQGSESSDTNEKTVADQNKVPLLNEHSGDTSHEEESGSQLGTSLKLKTKESRKQQLKDSTVKKERSTRTGRTKKKE